MWYRLTITNQSSNKMRYVFAYNMWDLFAVIGWLYSTLDMSFKIYYEIIDKEDMDNDLTHSRLYPDREFFKQMYKYREVDNK